MKKVKKIDISRMRLLAWKDGEKWWGEFPSSEKATFM